MSSNGKVIVGLVLFVVVVTAPIWLTLAGGGSRERPTLQPAVAPAGWPSDKPLTCVLEKEQMNHWHMDLLDQWRDAVVRGTGERYHVSPDGTVHEMSLSKTCLGCHQDKVQFCDRCHDYVGVSPYCWDCHVDPRNGIASGQGR